MVTRAERAPRTDPSIRRTQILDAAVDVFGKQGYRNGSLRDVADAVGLSIQGVLHHFPSKEELLLEVLGTGDGPMLEHLQ
ncbi:TetR/AcrR family transcriptional regulator, partial [Rhizobium johnstonii]|uniref:TetR/AcrR family transcriptional regulator n=1 Tax=Rhizobium johnstonii TaxID=3019933 RepID=UPI003F944EEE